MNKKFAIPFIAFFITLLIGAIFESIGFILVQSFGMGVIPAIATATAFIIRFSNNTFR